MRDELVRRAWLQRLASMPALGGISPVCLEALVGAGRSRFFRRAELAMVEGERCSAFYILFDGRMKICKALPSGRWVTLALLGPGDLFGMVAALGAESCEASVVALEPSSCLEIRREDLFALLRRKPGAVPELLPVLTGRLAECKNCLVEMSCLRLETRFARMLLKLGESFGERKRNTLWVPLALSRQELADLAGTTIESAIRIMSRWHQNGLVETRKKGFAVQNVAALEELAL